MSTTIYTPQDVYNFAFNGDEDRFIIALNQGDNSTDWYRGDNGMTACHWTAVLGYINIVEMILDRGFDIYDKGYTGWTILHYATGGGQTDIIEMLLERGFDINSKTDNGFSALHIAAKIGRMNAAELLLQRGIAIDDDIDSYAPIEEGEDENGNVII